MTIWLTPPYEKISPSLYQCSVPNQEKYDFAGPYTGKNRENILGENL